MRSYYVDLGYKDVRTGMYDAFVFDEDGIPRYPYGSRSFYNITFICHYALYQLSLHQKFRRADGLERFLAVSNWVAENGEETSNSFVFPYRFEFADLKPPWVSALGQGRLISVLTRAAEASGEERFMLLARKALHPFECPVEEGGVRRSFQDGGIAFEEYPAPKRNLVLNGMITALFGLYDLASAGDERAADLFDAAVDSLVRNLPRYDLGYWSAYDLTGPIRRVAGNEYHEYHIQLLWALFEMTGIEALKRTANKWDGYRKTPRLHFFRTVSRINTKLRTTSLLCTAALLLAGCVAHSQPEDAPVIDKAVAVTVDDIPGVAVPERIAENTDSLVAMNRRLIGHLDAFGAPTTAFVVPGRACSEGRCERLDRVLDVWLAAGHDLANHTLTHRSLTRISAEDQIEDIGRASVILRATLRAHGKELTYFRHPALHTGETAAKRDSVEAYLTGDGLQVAPVTIDNSEWIFASAYSRAAAREDAVMMSQIGREYLAYMDRVLAFYETFSEDSFGRQIPQILLIHDNALNAEYLGDLLAMMRAREYRFISLDEALQDSVYLRGNPYVGPVGLSWLQRWRVAGGEETLREPGYPGWINEQAGM